MTGKQRVYAALRREPVDRVPIFMWFHPETAEHLGKLLDIPASCVGQATGNDVRQTWVNNNYAMEGILHENPGDWHVDSWGIKWVMQEGFNQIARSPLAGASREQLFSYRFPIDHQNDLLGQMDSVVEAAAEEQSFLGCDISPCVFEMYWRLRGMEETLLDMALTPSDSAELFGHCADFAIRLGEAACDRFPLDWLWTGDDVAGQQSMIMSPDSWRQLIKPHLQRCFDVGRSHGLHVAYHCCGALHPIIPDLIEMGLSVLNPVQPQCPGMDPLELKKEFGKELTFMGGVDTQDLLPNGTATEVAKATERLASGMTADDGGFILAASHTVPPETPDENILAMYEAVGITREQIYDNAAGIRAALSDG